MNSILRFIIIGLLPLGGLVHADTFSTTLAGLKDFDPGTGSEERIDTLTITLDPDSNAIHGKPGDTVGWGFKVTWQSNANDVLAFTNSRLTGDLSVISSSGYTDVIGTQRGNTNHFVVVGTDWETPFVPNTQGTGYLTIAADAMPGATYEGALMLQFAVYDLSAIPRKPLNTFTIFLDVTVTVDPIDPMPQTITFAEISTKSITDATFTLSPTSSSGLPVELTSLNPDICTVDSDNVVTILAAGSCTLIATQEGNRSYLEALSVSQTFEVVKAPATVTITGSTDRSYNGADQIFTTSTTPPDLPVKMLYNGDDIPPRAPGIYLVQAQIDDAIYEGSAEVMLTITDHTPSPVNTYASWLQANFTPEEIQMGTITDPNAYLAGDEFNNLFKYALGFDPKAPLSSTNRGSLLQMTGALGAPSVIFEIPAIAPSDVTMTVQACDDLVSSNWQEIARRVGNGSWTGSAEVFTGTPDVTGTRLPVIITDPTPLSDPRRFYRMSISTAP